jgi:hypothetical protein
MRTCAMVASSDLFQEDFDFEEQLTEERDERVSPLIVGAAVIGLMVGLFVWGSLTLSMISGAGDFFDDVSTSPLDEIEPPSVVETGPVDCEALEDQLTLSEDQEAAYRAECLTQAAEATATPEAAGSGVNREDCDAIRGTQYRSAEERDWFLDNCVD